MNDNLPTPPLQETERDRWNYDVGFEAGHQEAPRSIDKSMARIKAVLRELIAELDQLIAEDTAGAGSGGTAWERHDDPEQQP